MRHRVANCPRVRQTRYAPHDAAGSGGNSGWPIALIGSRCLAGTYAAWRARTRKPDVHAHGSQFNNDARRRGGRTNRCAAGSGERASGRLGVRRLVREGMKLPTHVVMRAAALRNGCARARLHQLDRPHLRVVAAAELATRDACVPAFPLAVPVRHLRARSGRTWREQEAVFSGRGNCGRQRRGAGGSGGARRGRVGAPLPRPSPRRLYAHALAPARSLALPRLRRARTHAPPRRGPLRPHSRPAPLAPRLQPRAARTASKSECTSCLSYI